MPSTFSLFFSVLPLLGYALVGYASVRFLGVSAQSFARLALYVFTPAVILLGALGTQSSPELLWLPLVVFGACSLLGIAAYTIARSWLPPSSRSIVGLSAGTGNTGYMGLPVALALLGPDVLPIAVLAGFGFLLFEATFGLYFMARAHYSLRDSLLKVLRLPHLYALALGLLLTWLPIPTGPIVSFLEPFKGGYIVIGMALLGAGFSSFQRTDADLALLATLLINKFLLFPALTLLVIWLDITFVEVFAPLVHQTLFLLSIVPLAANTIVYATELNIEPTKVAFGVLLSTLVSLITIPLMLSFFFSLSFV